MMTSPKSVTHCKLLSVCRIVRPVFLIDQTAYCEAREGEHGKRAFAREELRAAGEQAVPIDVGRFSHAKPVDGHDERRGTHEEREGGGEDSARGDCGETSGDGDDAPTRRPGPRLSRNRPLSVSTPR